MSEIPWEYLPIVGVVALLYFFVVKPMIAAGKPSRSSLQKPERSKNLLNGFDTDVVGESHYQQNLLSIAGGRSEESVEIETSADLIPEIDNEYDKHAVRIDIDGLTVGYLSKANAKAYRRAYQDLQQSCDALIVGGWDRRKGDVGSFGVRLNINLSP